MASRLDQLTDLTRTKSPNCLSHTQAPSRPPQPNGRSSHLGVAIVRKEPWALYFLWSLGLTVATLLIATLVAGRLVLDNTEFQIPYDNGRPILRLNVGLVAIDPLVGTLILDWYPQNAADCSTNPIGVYDIYFDPNILIDDKSGGDDAPPPSNSPSSDASFSFNATTSCHTRLHDSDSTFRTTSKLLNDADSYGKSTLQAYPFDEYKGQISLFVLDIATNLTVPVEIRKTWGVAVNFNTRLDERHFNTIDGMYFILDISRSAGLKLFVVFLVISNWIVTLVFVWISTACFFWRDRVVKELFAIPISVLFAFTAVRSSMPGAPPGFGAYLDFFGILPNIVVMTFCSFALLFAVLYHRIVDEIRARAEKAQENNDLEQQALGQVIQVQLVAGQLVQVQLMSDRKDQSPLPSPSTPMPVAVPYQGHVD